MQPVTDTNTSQERTLSTALSRLQTETGALCSDAFYEAVSPQVGIYFTINKKLTLITFSFKNANAK